MDILIHNWQLSVGNEYSDMEVVSGIAGTASLSISTRIRMTVEDGSEPNCDMLSKSRRMTVPILSLCAHLCIL